MKKTTFKTWAKANRGRVPMLAKHFGITSQAIYQWFNNGVPRHYIEQLHQLTGLPLDILVARPIPEAPSPTRRPKISPPPDQDGPAIASSPADAPLAVRKRSAAGCEDVGEIAKGLAEIAKTLREASASSQAVDSPWLDAAAAAARLRISERQFRERVQNKPGFPPARRKPGLRLLWSRNDIDRWVS